MLKEIDLDLIQLFLDISIKEFNEKFWGLSQQYLGVMDILTKNTIPVISRIEEESDNIYAVYFSVKDQKFYYTHYFFVGATVELNGVGITPANTAYLRIYSEEHNIEIIQNLLSFSPTRFYRKGDKDKFMPIHKKHRLDFEPDENEAGNFEKKLLFLLNILERHEEELVKIKNLGCELYISGYWNAYIGNTMLGGFYLGNEIIKKLNKLNLEIDFDLHVSGVSFK